MPKIIFKLSQSICVWLQKKCGFDWKLLQIIIFLLLRPIKRKLGLIFETVKKFARWRHKSKISKRTVRSIISPLFFCLRGCLGYQNNQYGQFCWFGLLFSNFLIDFDDICRGFFWVLYHFGWKTADQTNNLWDGKIVEGKKFW